MTTASPKQTAGQSPTFFGLYDARDLKGAISAPKAVAALPAPPSVTPNLKVPSVVKFPIVMVAGMVTMLAMLVAGMHQWKKWNTSLGSTETDKILVVCGVSGDGCRRSMPIKCRVVVHEQAALPLTTI